MRIKVFIRADGSSEIGMGHLIRAFALAKMIDCNYSVTFLCKYIPSSFIQILKKEQFGFIQIQKESDTLYAVNKDSILIIDSYTFDIQLANLIRSKRVSLFYIDDCTNKSFDADLIINHVPGIKPEYYKDINCNRFALGIEFALLRPEFLNYCKTKLLKEVNRNIFVCFGGADYFNLTYSFLDKIIKYNFFESIVVVLGSQYNHSDTLVKFRKEKNVNFYENQTTLEMIEHMKNCTYAIAPASGISYELLAIGCTWIGGYYVDNQIAIYNGFKAMSCMVDLGDLRRVEDNFFFEKISNEVHSVNKRNLDIIDGYSDFRFKTLFDDYVDTNFS